MDNEQGQVIIPHKYRPERRARWDKPNHKLVYEYLRPDGTWAIDYTTWDSEMRDKYFQDFYGWESGNVNPTTHD